MNHKMIRNILGWILLFQACFLLVPLIAAVIYRENTLLSILASILICLAAGLLLARKKPQNTTIYAKEGFVIVSLSWVLLSLTGALPFWFTREIPSFVDALFETVSGFTTTGASILPEVETMSKSLLLWRSFTHWVGGMGVLVFIMAFIPLSGGQNLHIMRAESPGPSVSKLVPRIRTTAIILYTIYLVLTLVECVLLLFGDTTVFEALNISFSTAGTGGFGLRNDSMASFSPYTQIVVTVFMLLFSVNFSCFYLILIGRLKDAFNCEFRTFLIIVATAITLITVNMRHAFDSLGEALRHVSFTVASLISTTGFSTENFGNWSEFSRLILIFVMFIGACAGSTGGGIKVSRLVILVKGIGKELSTMVHTKQIKKITVDKRPVEHEVVRSVNVYMVSYLLIFAVSMTLVTLFDQMDLVSGFTAVLATFNNVGPGMNLVDAASNYGFLSIPSKLVLTCDMLIGRLELFPVLLLFSPATWKK